MTLPPYLKFQK